MTSCIIQQKKGVQSPNKRASGYGAPHHHTNLPFGQTSDTAGLYIKLLMYS